MRRANEIRSKDDVQRSYHNGTRSLPMLNVKVWATRDGVLRAARESGDPDLCAPMFLNWLAEVATDAELEGADQFARELGWEDATNDAHEVLGERVKVWSAGRSGGWLVVQGLGDVEGWDAIALSKWRRFARYVDAIVADHAHRIADGLRFNTFEDSPYADAAAIG